MPLLLEASPEVEPQAVVGEVGIITQTTGSLILPPVIQDNSIFNTIVTRPTDVIEVMGDYPTIVQRVNTWTTTATTINRVTHANNRVMVNGNVVFYTTSTGTTSNYYIHSTGGIIVGNNGSWNPSSPEYIERSRKKYERDRRASIHKAKSAIKKALKLIDNMGFGDEIRVFIGGDEIVVDNPNSIFKFVLKRGASLIDKTIHPGYSTPYKLELLTKDDIHVSNLCVYLPNTPVLDQVLAIALYIKSGDEEEVLTKANWFCVSRDEGVKKLVHDYNPLFGKKIGYRPNRQEPEAEGCFIASDIARNMIVTNDASLYITPLA